MRLPCWLIGHRREPESRFIRRDDGYPRAIYTACRNCDKRLNIVWNTRPEPAHRRERP